MTFSTSVTGAVARTLVLVVGFGGLAVLLLGSLLFAAGVGYAGLGDIYGTRHNVSSGAGDPLCAKCHIPHNATGDYLWALPAYSWAGESAILPLCFSCHDGTATGITDVGAYILNDGVENHIVYPGVEGLDCDLCHDPHDDAWVFLDAERFTSEYQNANMCTFCHDLESDGHGRLLIHSQDGDTDLPDEADRTWEGNTGDFSGTPLWDSDTGQEELATGVGQIKCMTCHRPHGAQNDGLNAMPLSDPDSNGASLCENCHQ